MVTTIHMPCLDQGIKEASRPIDPISFLHDRAGEYIDQLMGEMAFVAKDTLKAMIPNIDDVDIWSLAVEMFLFDGIKRRVEGPRFDTIESSSLKSMFAMAGASLLRYRDDPALPAVMQALMSMVSDETMKETQAYIIDKVLPVIYMGNHLTITYTADGRQIGRAKRMRFLYLESGIEKNAMDTAMCQFSGGYTHEIYAILSPLRTAVYLFLVFTYHTLWKNEQ